MKALFLLLFSSHLLAVSPIPLSNAEIADRLKLYQSIATLKAPFEQTKILKDLEMQIKSSGTFTLIRPDKVIWEVLRPSRLTLTLDSNRITLSSGDGKAAKTETWGAGDQIDETASRGLASLMAWLRIDVAAIQAAYEVSSLGKNEFRCVPKKKDEALFSSLTMKLHPKGHLESLSLDEKSGDRMEIRFSKPEITYRK